MIFLYKCISIEVREKNVNPIMIFVANFKVLKNKSK